MKHLLFSVLLCAASLFAAAPLTLNYQGYLTAPDGTPLDTVVTITFAVYQNAIGGSPAWTQVQPACTVRAGLFSRSWGPIQIEDQTFQPDSAWLGVTIGGDAELTPRFQLLSVPFALMVASLDGADGGHVHGHAYFENLRVDSLRSQIGILFQDGSWQASAPDTNSLSQRINAKADSAGNATRAWVRSMGYLKGADNFASSTGFVGGGNHNFARGEYSVIAGGGAYGTSDSNSVDATSQSSFVGAGRDNHVGSAEYSSITGGAHNSLQGNYSAILGGAYNGVTNWYSSVCGGNYNTATGTCTIVSGGAGNNASNSYSTVCGGFSNHARGERSTVAGGSYNRAAGYYSAVLGGGGPSQEDSNYAYAMNSSICGGSRNITSGYHSIIGGGQSNQSIGAYSVVAGGGGPSMNDDGNIAWGESNAIGGGRNNSTFSAYSSVPGGRDNQAAGRYSFAAGHKAIAQHDGSFVWADTTDNYVFSNGTNCFVARASGGVVFYSSGDLMSGVHLWPGTSAWTVWSDSTRKCNIRTVDTGIVLEKVSQLPIKQWSYKTQDPSVLHIGPMAQDFWNLFHLGEDSLGISTIDPDGIALAAIQELAMQNREMQNEIITLRAQIQSLLAGDKHANSK